MRKRQKKYEDLTKEELIHRVLELEEEVEGLKDRIEIIEYHYIPLLEE